VPSAVAPSVEVQLHYGRGWLSAETALERVVNRNDANGYYGALGLKPDATRDQIKAAYRTLAKQLYPFLDENHEAVFIYITNIVKVLLDPDKKRVYDRVSGPGAIYLGNIEREVLARQGLLFEEHVIPIVASPEPPTHWNCVTTFGHLPGPETDVWSELCRQVSPAVGYRGKIRAGVVEGGQFWPCEPTSPWGILTAGSLTFVIFQRGVEPNRLHALCAMIDQQKHLQKQIPHQERQWQ
jgi:hypothetical protein